MLFLDGPFFHLHLEIGSPLGRRLLTSAWSENPFSSLGQVPLVMLMTKVQLNSTSAAI